MKVIQAGRNDPCPCGSGKKFKHCCLNRLTDPFPSTFYVPEVTERFSFPSDDLDRRYEPCPCQSGKIYKRCCYPRMFPDYSKPNAGFPEAFLQQAALQRAIKRFESLLSRYDDLTIDSVEVGDTRLVCAAMQPFGEILDGTLAPPVPYQIEAKYEAIRNSNPDGVTEVAITYSYPEMFGFAEAKMLFDADEHFRLPDGQVISVLDLRQGMQIRMKDGSAGAIISAPDRRYELPIPPLQYDDGRWSSRVIGQVKHTSFEILEWQFADQVIRGTPGHLVWSETRQWWVRACELRPGEMIRIGEDSAVPVESVGPLRTGFIEVYGIEVEYFHNYFVGAGGNAMLVHNGPECIAKPIGVDKGHSYPAETVGYASRKQFRTAVAEAEYSTHGYKHLKATTEVEAMAFSSSGGAAQYLPKVSNAGLEKIALQKGFVVEQGGGYRAYIQFDQPIGFNNGKATTWIRAELSGKSYHGHPVLESELPLPVKQHFGL